MRLGIDNVIVHEHQSRTAGVTMRHRDQGGGIPASIHPPGCSTVGGFGSARKANRGIGRTQFPAARPSGRPLATAQRDRLPRLTLPTACRPVKPGDRHRCTRHGAAISDRTEWPEQVRAPHGVLNARLKSVPPRPARAQVPRGRSAVPAHRHHRRRARREWRCRTSSCCFSASAGRAPCRQPVDSTGLAGRRRDWRGKRLATGPSGLP